jgi:DNA-directed RNA polymerase subunit M/transcription elongation factor TFIIS
MASVDASQKRSIAKQYTLNHLYPEYDEAEIIEMKEETNTSLIGVTAKRYGLLGTDNEYAFLKIDGTGSVSIANKCSQSKMYENLGYETKSLAEKIESVERDLEAINRFGKKINRLTSGKKKDINPPSKCPKCEKKRTTWELITAQGAMDEISEGVYQCGRCGHIIRLDADNVHVHERSK